VLFRGRGMKRCLSSGEQRFHLFVAVTILANNLLKIAELLINNNKLRRRAA
jgi:IS5 family transposase